MTKFSLFLFPVVAVFMQRGQQPMLFGIKWGLIIGVAISMLFSFFRLLAVYAMNGELLRASEYALNMHTSYLALLIILATIIFFYERRTLGKFHWFFYPYLLLALFSIINLRSLGAIVCIGVIFTAVPLWYAFKKQKKRWLFIFPAYALGLLLLTYVSPQIKNDLNTSKERTATWMASPEQFLLDNKNDLESNTVRLVAWTLSYRAISEHPLGVGVGDKWDELEFYYRGKGFTFYVYKKLNVHNQFLESGIAIGIPGVLLLLVAFMQALIISWRKNQVIYFLIFLCLLTSNLFESMLERSVGVITLAMMIFVLIQTLKQAEAQNER